MDYTVKSLFVFIMVLFLDDEYLIITDKRQCNK